MYVAFSDTRYDSHIRCFIKTVDYIKNHECKDFADVNVQKFIIKTYYIDESRMLTSKNHYSREMKKDDAYSNHVEDHELEHMPSKLE